MPRRTFAAVVLQPPLAVPLLALFLSLPGKAVAGPPERPSGRMVLDEVADGLRQYRRETEAAKHLAWLRRLAPTGDPRVAIVLAETALNPNDGEVDCEAADELWWYYVSPDAATRRAQASRPVGRPPPRVERPEVVERERG